ncbi:30S ribosomal protein S8 [Lyticum sinuosum]|uniref:Small ribosomal subunit protein uS8 n=1 Tax=Lyticum sinuosum TaxID=1332059 RepID=A0AAE4VJC4_9RICK|nr:30S ribosomal protein S8 [Lyticum sinuosum]MDZ5760872.1 30S ribosomal protein S8 [Lyticum sinuosum]
MSFLGICNIVSSIKNACMVMKNEVILKDTKVIRDILFILKEEGYIKDYERALDDSNPNKKIIIVSLKYYNNRSVITEIKMISTPSRHVYSKFKDLFKYKKIMGVVLVSTNKGIKTLEKSINMNLGGKLICSIF